MTVTPISKLLLFLTPKSEVEVSVTWNGRRSTSPQRPGQPFDAAALSRPAPPAQPSALDDDAVEVPLIRLAWGRSGDKGNLFNVAAIARRPEYLPYIRAALTPERVGQWYAHLYDGAEPRVSMFDAPGLNAVNFVLHDSLDGGVLVSPKVDSAAKGMAQQLLEMPIRVPKGLLG